MVNPRVRVVSIMASIQSSKTLGIELAICYIIANLPGSALWLDQTADDVKDQAEARLHVLFEECEPVKALFPLNRHKKRKITIRFSNSMTL